MPGSKPGERRGGRQKGTPNKHSRVIKDAVLEAAHRAGGEEGLVGYLYQQALANPAQFLALLGKAMPLQVTGEDGAPIEQIHRIERVIVRPPARDT